MEHLYGDNAETTNDRLRRLKTTAILWLIEKGRPIDARDLSGLTIVGDEIVVNADSADINLSDVLKRFEIPPEISDKYINPPEGGRG